jgi:succinate dehydrogenase hydrophobic anchor subunit
MKKTGIFIVILGIGLIIFTISSSFTHYKTIDLIQVETSKNKQENLNWFPMIGIAALGIGAVVLKYSFEK